MPKSYSIEYKEIVVSGNTIHQGIIKDIRDPAFQPYICVVEHADKSEVVIAIEDFITKGFKDIF